MLDKKQRLNQSLMHFIYSDPVPMFLVSMCCFVLTLARTTCFIKGSKLQERVSLESGSFLYHMKTLCQHATGVCHNSTKENMALQRVWEGRNKEIQWLCSWRKTQTFCSLKDDYDLLTPKICIALKKSFHAISWWKSMGWTIENQNQLPGTLMFFLRL